MVIAIAIAMKLFIANCVCVKRARKWVRSCVILFYGRLVQLYELLRLH